MVTDAFSETTGTLTRMIPVGVAAGALERTRRRAAPKRRATVRRKPVKPKAVKRKVAKRKATKSMRCKKRTRRR